MEIHGERVTFHEPFLEAALTQEGISIPGPSQAEFDGKGIVTVEDSDFARAFRDVYYPLSMNSDTSVWRDKVD